MILLYFLIILFAAAFLAWGFARFARWIALVALAIDGCYVVSMWSGPWMHEINLAWIPQLGANFHLAIDGISLSLLALTVFLGIIAVVSSWNKPIEQEGFFYCNILWLLALVSTLFLAVDLLLFYFAWELMLIPTYFLIAIWGDSRRFAAATKFFLFTQFGGLFLLVAIIALYLIHGQNTGQYTFNYESLINTPLSPTASIYLMLGFSLAFLIKLPAVFFHSWAPDAYAQAPAPISLLLSGLLAKTGAYGLIRFVLALFPHTSAALAPFFWGLGILSILYGACLAFTQTDLKRLIAYSSISHMGFVLIGIFSGSSLAIQGALIIMLAHGLSSSALFLVAGDLEDRLHTRDISHMGGLWAALPILSAIALFFALASLGLPGLGNFVGEFLVILGLSRTSIMAASCAAIGFVLSAIYILWMVQRVFFGGRSAGYVGDDIPLVKTAGFCCIMAGSLWLGLFPAPFFYVLQPAVERVVGWGALPPIPPAKGRALWKPQNCAKTGQEPSTEDSTNYRDNIGLGSGCPLFVAPVSFAEKIGAIIGDRGVGVTYEALSPIVAQYWGFQRARPLAGCVGGSAPHLHKVFWTPGMELSL